MNTDKGEILYSWEAYGYSYDLIEISNDYFIRCFDIIGNKIHFYHTDYMTGLNHLYPEHYNKIKTIITLCPKTNK